MFSAISNNIPDDEILKFELPRADENEQIYKKNTQIIQHPLADIEIVAEDSSSVFIVAKDDIIAEKFHALFPKAKMNY